jgi:hypothetical protein
MWCAIDKADRAGDCRVASLLAMTGTDVIRAVVAKCTVAK